MKRTLIAILLVATFGTVARAQLCGPDVKHSAWRVESQSPLEANPPAGKALVYVLSPRQGGGMSQVKVSADRVWIGVNEMDTYFVAALDPGTHDFCSKSGPNVAHLKLTLEAGKSYYLEQHVVIGWNSWKMHGRTTLQEITEEDTAGICKKCKRMEFSEKKGGS
jgi:hypothetical protein